MSRKGHRDDAFAFLQPPHNYQFVALEGLIFTSKTTCLCPLAPLVPLSATTPLTRVCYATIRGTVNFTAALPVPVQASLCESAQTAFLFWGLHTRLDCLYLLSVVCPPGTRTQPCKSSVVRLETHTHTHSHLQTRH